MSFKLLVQTTEECEHINLYTRRHTWWWKKPHMHEKKIGEKSGAEQGMHQTRKKEKYWHVNPIGNKHLLIYFTNYKDDPCIYVKFALYISHQVIHIHICYWNFCECISFSLHFYGFHFNGRICMCAWFLLLLLLPLLLLLLSYSWRNCVARGCMCTLKFNTISKCTDE